MRVGKAEAGAASFDLMNYQRAERVNPTPLRDKEAFIQTWLYFGFICEFLCANSKDNSTEATPEGCQDVIDQVYDMMLVPNGDKFNIELDDEGLNKFLSMSKPRLPEGREAQIKHFEHLLTCIAHAHPILSQLPKDFNHTVKYSISGLYELVAQTIRAVFLRLGVQRIFGRGWAVGYLNQEAKVSMMRHGWCPSDIARAEAKFQSLQAIHVLRMMDNSLPKRDHSRCTDAACNIYQINLDYKVGHQQSDCSCEELVVNPQDLEEILHKEERIPLLRLTGDLHNLKADLVESDINTPYIAISHVWADGLGNPRANSLHRCKLIRLRELVSTVGNPSTSTSETPLIWLDTLCCPAKDGEGKQKAIEKIRLVYQRARHVLVLDAGLLSYSSATQSLPEKIARIFTSGWVRRLWTLQEGALAPSLYFQFADEAVSLIELRKSLGQHVDSVRHQVFAIDAMHEFWRIDAFFKSKDHNVPGDQPDLVVLDQALLFRGVSVASDEPLCIGTLMSLDLPTILAVEPKENRMQKVWELLATKKGGIPALVIFFQDKRLDSKGWRWAPQSLLTVEKSFHQASTRIVRWSEGQLGIPTSLGLKVRFPGFKISISKYTDGKPRHPWPGLKRIPESYMHFRDTETGEWYTISDKKFTYLSSTWKTEEEREEYNKLGLFPLHDVADSDKALVVMTGKVGETLTSLCEAIFGFPVADDGEKDKEIGIALQTERHIIVNPLMPENGYLYTTIGKLAMELRGDKMTDKHLELYELLKAQVGEDAAVLKKEMQENEEFKASVKGLREKMKVMTAEVIKEDERFVGSVKNYFGASFLDDIWVLIQDWFNHDFLGTKLDEQVWYVD
jgi:hypothetical protein